MLQDVTKRLSNQDVTLNVTSSAIKALAKVGFDAEYGARPLRRAIQNKVEDQIANLLLANDLHAGQTLKVGFAKKEFTFDVQ